MPWNKPGVVCFEGEWDDEKLDSRLSAEPALRLLESAEYIRLVHRDVPTIDAFEFQIERWLRTKQRGYDLAYFSFHGSSKELYLPDGNTVTLDNLADMLDGRAQGKTLYFAACRVMAAPDEYLVDFCKRTGARAIAGYTRNVEDRKSVV